MPCSPSANRASRGGDRNPGFHAAFPSIMAPLDASTESDVDAAIRDLMARTPTAPRDPTRTRIMQMASGQEALLAALQFAQSSGTRRRR